MRYLLIHPFRRSDDGAFIRVKNLNSHIAEFTGADCTEVAVVSLRYFPLVFRNNQRPHVFKKSVFLPILWRHFHAPGRIWGLITSWIAGMILAVFVRPDIITGETSHSWLLARAVKRWRPGSKLIMDLHGALPEEMLFHYPPSARREIAVWQEAKQEMDIVRNSDFLICQSENIGQKSNRNNTFDDIED